MKILNSKDEGINIKYEDIVLTLPKNIHKIRYKIITRLIILLVF